MVARHKESVETSAPDSSCILVWQTVQLPEPEKKVPCWVDNAASAGAGVGSIRVGVGWGAQAARSKITKKIYPYFFTI
jgi:hypothetical protein